MLPNDPPPPQVAEGGEGGGGGSPKRGMSVAFLSIIFLRSTLVVLLFLSLREMVLEQDAFSVVIYTVI